MAIKSLIPWKRDRATNLVPWSRDGAMDVRARGEDPFWSLHREMNRLFEDFDPRIDVRETDNEVLVTAEMPGLEKKDFQLDLTADALTIRGEKRREHEEKGSVHRFERSYGAFERTIPLPCEVEADKASATYRNGVLDVTLPKAPSARRSVRRIEVRGE